MWGANSKVEVPLEHVMAPTAGSTWQGAFFQQGLPVTPLTSLNAILTTRVSMEIIFPFNRLHRGLSSYSLASSCFVLPGPFAY